ncbi:M56 family metallopeptidase [Desulfoscipio gibsoniae]|uniref:Antirepressor regulating drug resistance protein n=1 Tax=Desulfoscipio gibsoniae DSM 7213 TaxID=767817 RepID=R4KDT4_9FIRM|nr:peptidase M56 [Desulfoscipio gibsoniae]AGK99841.1 antirepressor regulating drug resistance protein [Desulfoscipio gibsoniae DSM 7213]
MMNFFDILLKMSLQASLLICVIMVLRTFIAKLPKVYTCMLWVLVLIRLLCPIFIESGFSLVPQMDGEANTVFSDQSRLLPAEPAQESFADNASTNGGEPVGPAPANSTPIYNNETVNTAFDNSIGTDWSVGDILFILWMIGIVLMVVLHITQYVRMKKMLRTAVHTEEGVWECDRIHSPFVMGCIKPRIYLPFGITGVERAYIVSHERSHIHHFDPQLCILEIAALCLHWWNPFVWLAVYRMNQDREMLCDEAVLKHADINTRKEYSATLLQFAMKQSKLAVIVSFGETNTESSIKHILKFRRPTAMISAFLILIVGICAFCFLTVPGIEATPVMDSKVNGTDITPEVSLEQSDTGLLGDKEYADLIMKYLEEDNNAGFASLIKYPIKLYVGDQQKVIYNEEEFLTAYDQIIQEDFKASVLATDTDNLPTNMYGVRMGNGELWFEKFDSTGYQIYAINNSSVVSYPQEDIFITGWNNKTMNLDMSMQEKDTWYSKIIKDIPHAEESYEIRGVYYEDMDKNGSLDLLLLLKLRDGAITPESYPGTYLCIYMNDDPVYLKEYKESLYLAFRHVLYGDVDRDGCTEIIYSIDTGGNGGNGSAEKSILKYKEHTLMQMSLPGDDLEELEEDVDEGYEVKVLYGKGENEYKAVCDSLGRTVEFHGKNAVDANGNKSVQNIRENELAGGNCRGYTEFSIISKSGQEYLQAKEYLHGEGGINHCVGWASFLMDWDENGNPSVLKFDVEEL